MKKPVVLLTIFLVLSVSLWLTHQQADSNASLKSASEAQLRGDYSEAQSQFEKLASAPSDTASARRGLLQCLLATGQYDRALKLTALYIQESPETPDWHFFQGRVQVLLGKYQEAQLSFTAAARAPSSVRNDAQVQLALLLKMIGKLQDSRDLFTEVYERISAADSSQLGLAALALQHLERFKEANGLFIRATKQDPKDFDTWVAWGNLFLEKYDPANGASVFADVLKQNAKHPEALLGMVLCRGEGSGEEVEEIFKKIFAVNPNLEAAHAARAQSLLQAENYEEATKEITACFKINPKSLQGHTLQAVLQYAAGNGQESEASAGAALQINPSYGQVFESLGHFCVTQRLYRESVTFFRRAIETNPRLWKAYAALGVNLLRIGEEQAAKEALDLAFEQDPYNVWTYNTLKLIDSYSQFDQSATANFNLRLHRTESRLLAHYVPALLEEAYETLSRKYEFRPKTPIYFEMFPDHEDFAVRTLGVPGLGALGVCFGRGVVMDSPRARPVGSFNWGSTLWHEFAHVVTLQLTGHRVPRWFTEGLSVMEEHHAKPGWGNDLNLEVVRAIQDKKLLPIAELNRGFLRPRFPHQVQLSYFQAGQACEFIQTEFGFKSLLKMLQLFKVRKPLPEVFRECLGITTEEFDSRFNAYLEARFGRIVKAVDFTILEKKELLKDPEGLAALLKEQPDNFFANLKLAGYYRNEGNDEKAIAYLQKTKSLFPGYVGPDNAYKQLSEIYKRLGRLNDAIAELESLTSISDSDFESFKQLAIWLDSAKRPLEARKPLEQAMFVYPFDQETHELLARLAHEAKDHEVALREYRALLDSDPPDKATAHLNVARVLIETGKKAAAKKEALAALEIAPGFEPAQELLLKTLEPGQGHEQ
jgi:tetratricopeptide (TPR) repeat protein